MMRHLLDLVSSEAGQRLHRFAWLVLLFGLMGLFISLSVVFGAYAAFHLLRDSAGPLVSGISISALFALAAMVCGLWLRARMTRNAVLPSVTLEAAVIPTGAAPPEMQWMALAVEAGQKMTIGQIIAMALIAGVVTGRKIN